MPVSVPVTLVMIDNVSGELARLALNDTLAQIAPARTLVYESGEWAERLWRYVAFDVSTSHILTVQWDGWVLDASRWCDEWLEYDYIGALWPWYADTYRVGNGGFSLRSKKLLKRLASIEVPQNAPEDAALCRSPLRQQLEEEGFKWAPESVARAFSFERELPREATFGFHGAFNFRRVLTHDALLERVLGSNDYVRAKREWHELMGEGAIA